MGRIAPMATKTKTVKATSKSKSTRGLCYEHTALGRDVVSDNPNAKPAEIKKLVKAEVDRMKRSKDPETTAYFKQLTDEAMFGVTQANTTRAPTLAGVRSLPKPKSKTPNAWTQFTRDYKPVLKKQNPELSGTDVVKLLSEKWKALKITNPTLVTRYSCPHNPKPTVEELTEAFEQLDIKAAKPTPTRKPKGRRPPPPTHKQPSKGREFSKLFRNTTMMAEPVPHEEEMFVQEGDESEEGGIITDDCVDVESLAAFLTDPEAESCMAKSVNKQLWVRPKTGVEAQGWRSQKLLAERSKPKIFAKDWTRQAAIGKTKDWFRRSENMRGTRAIRQASNASIYTSGKNNVLNNKFYTVVNDPSTTLKVGSVKNSRGYYSVTVYNPQVCVEHVQLELEVADFPALATRT